MRHLIERRRNQSAQANYICFFFARRFQNFRGRDHHAKIDNFIIVTLQNDAHDVFAYVVHVAFDRRHDDAPLRFRARRFFRLHERHQIGDGFFHDACAFHDLGQKHFAGTEQIPNHTHPGHERTFDHVERPFGFLPRLLGVDVDEIDNAFDQRMFQPFFDRL